MCYNNEADKPQWWKTRGELCGQTKIHLLPFWKCSSYHQNKRHCQSFCKGYTALEKTLPTALTLAMLHSFCIHLLKAIKHIMVSERQNIPALRVDRDSAEAKCPWTKSRLGRPGRWIRLPPPALTKSLQRILEFFGLERISGFYKPIWFPVRTGKLPEGSLSKHKTESIHRKQNRPC